MGKTSEYVGSLWEEWRDIEGYEGKYQVSNEGRVRSLNYNHTGQVKVMKAGKLNTGYLLVCLWKDGKMKSHLIHRLVWEAFRGTIPSGLQINHLDERKDNNCLENLEVCTCRENNNYGTHNERMAKALKKVMIGKFVNRQDQSKPIHQIDRLTGEVINTYPSCMEAERQTGINNRSIAKCCKGNPQHSHAGGFKWRYVSKCQSERGLCPQY